MVQNLMDHAQNVPPVVDDAGDPDYVPLESEEESEEESNEVSDGHSETADDDKDPEYIPLDEDAESFDEEAYNEMTETWRCKWTCDGAKSIDDMIAKLQAAIESLRKYKHDGWVLEGEVDDDYATLLSPEWAEHCQVRGVPTTA
ncbi:g711 [Coccomyxa elongata]